MKTGNWSPWGSAQSVWRGERGLFWVSTAGHGGMAVSEKKAEKELSARARSFAIHQNGYYWFEEDCAWALAIHEHLDWHRKLFPEVAYAEATLVSTTKHILESYYPETRSDGEDYMVSR